MNDEFGNPIEPGMQEVHMQSTGHMKPIPRVSRVVHGNIDPLSHPTAELKVNGIKVVAGNPEPKPIDSFEPRKLTLPDESAILGRFDDPLVLANDYPVASPDDEWHLWTTAAGDKTEDKLGVTVRLFNRELTFDSVGTLVKVKSRATTAQDSRQLSPWQCYVVTSEPDSVSLKVNPVSTLMRTYGYRGQFSDARWFDKYNVTNFTNTFTLTNPDHVVWLEVEYANGKITAAEVKSGGRWYFNLYYVDTDNKVSAGGNFVWYQLLAYFKLSSDPGGSEVDAVFSNVNYKLMCPTTTHLLQGYVRGPDDFSNTDPTLYDFYAIVPWHGCVWNGS